MEGGASVRYRPVAGRLERVSGSAHGRWPEHLGVHVARLLIGTRYTIVMTLALTGPSGERL